MNDKDQDRFADDLLDGALASYSKAAPRPGLEGRILARVRERERQERFRFWALAGAAAAAVILLVVLLIPHRAPVTVSSVPKTSGHSPAVAPVVKPPTRSASASTSRTVRTVKAMRPRPEQFPTPAPLSPEEKLLLTYVAQIPKEELAAAVKDENEERTLEIPPLKIAALKMEDSRKSEE